MRKTLNNINKLYSKVLNELGKQVVGVRVFANCLLLYFEKGSCRFYSKMGLDWGSIGSLYFVSNNLHTETITNKFYEEYEALINWYEEYTNTNNIFYKLWLMLVYNIKFENYVV